MKNIISKKSIKIVLLAVALILVVVGIYFAYKFNYIPHRKFEDKDFGIEFLHSTSDADRDGVDDYQDILHDNYKHFLCYNLLLVHIQFSKKKIKLELHQFL